MLNSFIIVLREGFESFLLVAVILAYLRKSGQKWLNTPVYVAIAVALAASGALAYVLNNGINESAANSLFGETVGGYINQFFANEALREAVGKPCFSASFIFKIALRYPSGCAQPK